MWKFHRIFWNFSKYAKVPQKSAEVLNFLKENESAPMQEQGDTISQITKH